MTSRARGATTQSKHSSRYARDKFNRLKILIAFARRAGRVEKVQQGRRQNDEPSERTGKSEQNEAGNESKRKQTEQSGRDQKYQKSADEQGRSKARTDRKSKTASARHLMKQFTASCFDLAYFASARGRFRASLDQTCRSGPDRRSLCRLF